MLAASVLSLQGITLKLTVGSRYTTSWYFITDKLKKNLDYVYNQSQHYKCNRDNISWINICIKPEKRTIDDSLKDINEFITYYVQLFS